MTGYNPRSRRARQVTFMPWSTVTSILIGLCVVAGIARVLNSNSASISSDSALSTAAANAQAPATATAFALHPLVQGPYLGGPYDVFGTTFPETTDVNHRQGSIAGYAVELYERDGSGTDQHGRVIELDLLSWTGSGDAATAETAIMKALMPPDAHFVRDATSQSDDGFVRHVYFSQTLANSVDPMYFVDEFGLVNPIPLGTFEWYCYPFQEGYSGLGYCRMATEAPL